MQSETIEAGDPRTRLRATVRWSLATRIAFRFAFSYFSLFCVPYWGS